MAKGKATKKKAVSKSAMRESAAELGALGAVEAVAGINDLSAGATELGVARDLDRASMGVAVQGASDVTRGVDAMRAGAAMNQLGGVVTAAGILDVAEGEALLSTAGDAAIVALTIKGISQDEISQGMELAGMAGQMRAVRDVVDLLGMKQMSDFLGTMTTKLHAVAVYDLIRSQESRRLALRARGVASQVADLGANEQAEGVVRIVAGQQTMAMGQLVAQAGAVRAAEGIGELQDAVEMDESAYELEKDGVAYVAEGARELGTAQVAMRVADAVEERALEA